MSKWELPPVTKEMKQAAEAEVLMQQESLKESSEGRPLDAYLNPRTKRVFDFNKSTWVDKPVAWNKLIKLPLELKDVMTTSYDELEDKYDISEIAITTDDGYYISDNYSDYYSGQGISVCREKGYPFKRFVNRNNETSIIMFNTLQDAYEFYLKDKEEMSKLKDKYGIKGE